MKTTTKSAFLQVINKYKDAAPRYHYITTGNRSNSKAVIIIKMDVVFLD
jgi:hypothetical protein